MKTDRSLIFKLLCRTLLQEDVSVSTRQTFFYRYFAFFSVVAAVVFYCKNNICSFFLCIILFVEVLLNETKNAFYGIAQFYWKIKKIGIYSMQNWTATTSHGVTRERRKKRWKWYNGTGKHFRKNPKIKDIYSLWT